MARQNKWAQFGQAFNAVYDAGTTLGQAIETGGIAFKDYEDEEGNALTGIALDRAKNSDYAAAEQKYGDPMEALRIKTGFETSEQNKIKTAFDTDTFDDRVARVGLDNASVGANTNLTDQTTEGLRLDNNIKQLTSASTVRNTNVTNNLDSRVKLDPSAKDAGISKNKLETATNNLATSRASLMSSIINKSEYQSDFVAGELAKVGRFRSHEENLLALEKDPKTLELMKQNVENNLQQAENAALTLDAENTLFNSKAYQDAVQAGGLAQAEAIQLAAQGEIQQLKKTAAANAAITTWAKGATAENPASMPELIETLTALDPELGMKLQTQYGEHQLWGITNDSLQMRARVNQEISTNGARGAMKVLDELNGDKFGMKIIKREGGGTAMVETRAVGPGGRETEVVRVIAEGTDEATFLTDLNAKMDPSSMLEYAMNLNDMRYKDGVTAFNLAQAKAAGVGKRLTADQWAAGVMQNGGTEAQLMAASAFIFKDNPDMAADWVAKMMINQTVPVDADVPPKLENTVTADGPPNEAEETQAQSVLQVVSSMTSSVADRKLAMSGNNKVLLQKYHPEVYQLELNKNDAAAKMIESLKEGDGMLNVRNLNQLIKDFMNVEAGMGEGSLQSGGNLTRNQQLYKTAGETIQAKTPEVLSIVRSMVQNGALKRSGGIDMTTLSKGSNPGKVTAQQELINSQVASLDELIKSLAASR